MIRRARRAGVPVLFLVGDARKAPPVLREDPALRLVAIAPPGTPRDESMRDAATFLEETTALELEKKALG